VKGDWISKREIRRRAMKNVYRFLRKKSGVLTLEVLSPLCFGASLEEVMREESNTEFLNIMAEVFELLNRGGIIDDSGCILKVPSFDEVKKCFPA